MGLGLGKLLGKVSGETAKGLLDGLTNGIDKLSTSKEEKYELQIKAQQLQTAINEIEAGHRTLFIAGWRPFIGWVCGIALAYNYILRDLFNYYIHIQYPNLSEVPALQMEQLMTVLMGMLGLGVMRTFEKVKGKAR